MNRLFITCFFIYFTILASAQSKTLWSKLSDTSVSVLDGQAWSNEIGNSIQRLPARAEKFIDKHNWDLSHQSSGLSIRFLSNAPEIIVRYKVTSPINYESMLSTGVRGVDLFALDTDGMWRWAGGKSSFKDTIQYVFAKLRPNDSFHKLGREYRLYLPLYNHVSNLEIGVPDTCLFKILPQRLEKPIVMYGATMIQGGSVSRPGMALSNILSRKLDRTVVNLGFSNSFDLDEGIINIINEIDARIYVLDCFTNNKSLMNDPILFQKRIFETVKTIRSKHPNTPILFTEAAGYTDNYLIPEPQTIFNNSNNFLNEAIENLNKEGVNGLYLLTNKQTGIDDASTIDGINLNDIGIMRYATAFENKIREIFNEPVGELKTQMPIPQRRTPASFDWEFRHKTMLKLNKTEPNKVLLIGNSITHNWGGNFSAKQTPNGDIWQKYLAPYGVRNMGFGADRIENVLWRVYHDEIDGINPEKIILSMGTNNLRVNTNEEIVEGLRFLLQAIRLHQPKAKITLLAIYPRRDQEERIIIINKAIHAMAKSIKVKFEDIGKGLLQKDGKINETLFNDGLHPKTAGYEILGKKLEAIIKKN